jgi:hypothetical protein
VNHNDCTVQVDRYYPLTLPTIQMKRGKKVTVVVDNLLPFETLSLDFQTAQAVAGTDQTQSILTAALTQAKGFLGGSAVRFYEGVAPPGLVPAQPPLDAIKDSMDALLGRFADFANDAIHVYAELQESLGTIPPRAFSLLRNERLPESPLFGKSTPLPWHYDNWRNWMLCEMGTTCVMKNAPPLKGLLGVAARLANDKALATCPASTQERELTWPMNESIKGILDCQLKALARVPDTDFSAQQKEKVARIYAEYGALSADNAVLANVIKDLDNYLVNIEQLKDTRKPVLDKDGNETTEKATVQNLGQITDPADTAEKKSIIAKLLGRQVVYSVNAVNGIGTFVGSVPTATQKKSIATVTVLYADPILEASAGVFFSSLPNRSFANQTIVTPNPGAALTQGDIVITQTISRPTVVPFAAANWRLGRDFLVGRRRGAFYITAAIGLNPNNTSTEFGVGPSFSWRALMFSALYHEGRDLRLTQGEQVGSVWCNAPGTDPTVSACKGNPPSPSTERYWTRAFAFGISVRVPSVFGGSSSSSASSSTGTSGSSGH